MGSEAACRAQFGGRSSEGKALLEAGDLQFRGAFRLKIPLKQIKTAEARRGVLVVTWPGGTAEFELGPAAEPWALKIRYPRSLVDKIGVKPGMRVRIAGRRVDAGEPGFWDELRERAASVVERAPRAPADIILLFVTAAAELEQLTALGKRIVPVGAIWVIYPKGRKEIREADVLAGGKRAGLVDVKIASFSGTHSALKMMIPVSKRKPTPRSASAPGS